MSRHEKRSRWAILAVVSGVALVLFVGGVAGFYVYDTGEEPTTIRGLSISGHAAGQLTASELEEVVDLIEGEVAAIDVKLNLPDGTRVVEAAELGISVDRDDIMDRAFAAGQEGGAFDRFRAWLGSFTTGRRISHRLVYDRETAAATVAELDGLVVSVATEPSLVLATDQSLAVRPGGPGEEVDQAAIVDRLGHQVEVGGPFDVDAPTVLFPPRATDEEVAELATRLNALTAQGATLVIGEEERTLPPEALRIRLNTASGADGAAPNFDLASLQNLIEHTFGGASFGGSDPTFDIVDGEPVLVEEGVAPEECCAEDSAERVAEAIFADRAGRIEIDSRPTEDPDLIAWADGSQIVELVAEFTTNHSCCESRVNNIHNFADLVRGVYLVPGESLSLNEHVGERTRERGFVPAGTILQGHLVPTVGGGVSQFATTMFNAAFFAGFDFITYQSHTIYFSRYPFGREATISWPAPDLEFENTTDHPALIWTSYTDTSITVSIYSTKSVDVEEVRQELSSARQCRRVDTFRLRTYDDGRQVEDSVFATYRPGEGIDCNGNPTERPDTP